MTHLRPVILLALLAVLASAAPASANYRVGIGDQSPSMFAHPQFQELKLKRTRYLLAWDWYKKEADRNEVAAFMTAARQQNFEVLVTFTAKRGCFVNNKYKKTSACKAPSTSALKSSFKRFRTAYPWAKLFAAWNEGNHVSQPTFKSPKTAA